MASSPSAIEITQQKKEVKGIVTDESGQSLPGVSVSIKGTNEGTNTDIDGKWVLDVLPTDILEFSFMGMKDQFIKVGDKLSINVILVEDRESLDEVIVTAYGTQKKGSVAGSVSVVKNDEIANVAVAGIGQMLQGKTSGVDIVASSGNPGASAKIVIRGSGSISAGTDPLVIVDGMPINGGLNSINGNDIESISTLKDASAVALYGAKAANGVLLVTTKQGKAGDMKVNFSTTYGFVDALLANYDMMSSKELLDYQKDIMHGGHGGYYKDNQAKLDELAAINTDWKDELLQTGIVKTYNLSVAGGTEKAHFYLGLNNYDEEGVIKKVYFKRKGLTFNADMEGTDWLTVGVNLNVSATESREARSSRNALNPFQAVYGMLPFETMYNEDGSYNKTSQSVNPIENTVNCPSITNKINFNGSVWTKIKLTKDLNLTSRMGATRVNYKWKTMYKRGSHFYQAVHSDQAYENYSEKTTYLANSMLDYSKTFNDIHDLSLKAIVETQKFENDQVRISAKNFPSAKLDYLASAAEPIKAYSSLSEWALMSYMFNAKYVYDSKYIADVSVRRDGSSRFGRDTQYGTFWSVGTAWNMHKESFIQDIDLINRLSLRGSIGTSGNDNIGYYDHLALVGFGKYNGQSAAAITNLGNADLKWETTLQASFGVDFSIMNDRISGSLEVYQKNTKDLLLAAQLSRTTGFSSITKNIGEITNTGIEFMINATVIKMDDFSWDLGFNIYHNKSVVDKLFKGNDIKTGYNILRENEEMYAYYMVRYAGINPDNGNPQYYNKNGEVTDNYSSDDRVLMDKSPFPDFAGSINTEFKYKGFSLGANFYIKQGNYMYNIASSATHTVNDEWSNLSRDLIGNVWTKPGDNAKYRGINSKELNSCDLYLEDASYVRLRDLKFSYSLPSSILKKINVDKLSFSVRGHNLWTYAPNFTGPDPEIGDGGESDVSGFGTVYDYSYPSTKSITFGIELTF